MLHIRPIRLEDQDEILSLATLAGVGMTSLPQDPEVMRVKLRRAVASFQGAPEHPQGEAFLFALVDGETHRIVGTTGIVAHVGTLRPFYSYKRSTIVQASEKLGIYSLNDVLHMVNDYTGVSEIGSLFLLPEYRRDGIGRFLSRARYLVLAEFPQLFSDVVISEIRGVQSARGDSPFYHHLARHFFQMEFKQADFIYATEGGQFIADLMPRYPIYVKLLAEEAQEVIGQPLEASRPALKLLMEEGFTYKGYVDIFDAGPTVQCDRAQIRTVRESAHYTVAVGDASSGTPWMVSNLSLAEFCVVRTQAVVNGNTLTISEAAAATLGVRAGSVVRAVA